MRPDLPSDPLLLHPAHPLDAVHAPGGGAVDLLLFPANGAAPICARLTGHQVQLLMVSVRTAQQSAVPDAAAAAGVDPVRADLARGGLSPADWLTKAFSGVLPPKRAASSSSTSARNSGTSNSAPSVSSTPDADAAVRCFSD